MMLFSHHSHSGQFCGHAKNTLEEMIVAAKKKSFHTLAMTEHMPRDETCDLYPEEVDLTFSPLKHQCFLMRLLGRTRLYRLSALQNIR